jgi:hypothetical protein
MMDIEEVIVVVAGVGNGVETGLIAAARYVAGFS